MNVPRSLFNSVVVAVAGVSLNVFFSSWVAYALAKLEFPLKNLLLLLVLGLMILPQQILMLPLFLQVDRLGMVDTYAGIVLPGAITPSPYSSCARRFFLCLTNTSTRPSSTAPITSRFCFASPIPSPRPLMLTAVVINFYWTWNAFLWPYLVIRSDEMTTLPIALDRYHAFADQRWDAIMAAATVVALPIILLYLVIQRQFVESLTMSGLKG